LIYEGSHARKREGTAVWFLASSKRWTLPAILY
jgi:hypothetical protein